MGDRAARIKDAIGKSLQNARVEDAPYRHWLLENLVPADVHAELKGLSYPIADLKGVSGTREVHNKSRHYFDEASRAEIPVARDFAAALQAPETVALFNETFGVKVDGGLLRIEFAQDTDGFWLEPHTDIGVKLFTLLYYLSDDPDHLDLGTDIYSDAETHAGRAPFTPNGGLVFIPAQNTWHGFESRPIRGIRKSIIINYVTQDWRAREQLAYPDQPVAAA